jgi:hypothetical protein
VHTLVHALAIHILLALGTQKPNTPLGEFQDSLNDVMHEENSPNKDFDVLIRISNIGLLPRNIRKHVFKEKLLWKKMA